MRVISAEDLAKEPYGTVYIKFIPRIYIGEARIKAERRGYNAKSWWATDLLPWVVDEEDFITWKHDNRYELKTEEFTTDDSIYCEEEDVMYAIFNKEEIEGMIERLKMSLEIYDNNDH